MGYWKIVRPAATRNYIRNPQGESTTYWTTDGTSTVQRSNDVARFGIYSIKASFAHVPPPSWVGYSQSVNLSPGDYVFSAYAYSTALNAITVRILLDGAEVTSATVALPYGRWHRFSVGFSISGPPSTFEVRFEYDGSSGSVYLEGLQLEVAPLSTYCDGEQPWCRWVGPAHNSESVRDLVAGMIAGEILDLEDDIGIRVINWTGLGVPQADLATTPSPTRVGAAYWEQRVKEREIAIQCAITEDSLPGLHSVRQALTTILGGTLREGQPVMLIYTGTGQDVYIPAYYVGGYEMQPAVRGFERFIVKFRVPDVYLYEDNVEQVVMPLPTLIWAYYCAARIDGQWQDILQTTDAPVYGLRRGPDGYVYAFGEFTSITDVNGTTVSAARIARYDPDAKTWSALGPGLNNIVRNIAWDPNGNLYAVGDFTATGDGLTTLNHVARWDGSAWQAMNGGLNDSAYDLAWDYSTGTLVVVGYFYTINVGTADQVDTNYIARWDGTKWTTVEPSSTGTAGWDSAPITVEVAPDGVIYVGGWFTKVPDGAGGQLTAYRVAYNDGSAWYPMANGFNDVVYVLMLGQDGYLYAGGKFSSDGLNTAGANFRHIARWNGSAWEELPDKGIDGEVWWLAQDKEGSVVVGGSIWRAGHVRAIDGIALWNGTTFVHADIDFLSTQQTNVWDVDVDRWGSWWIAHSTAAGARVPQVTTVTNSSSSPVVPILYARGPIRLLGLYNFTTKKTIYMDIRVDDGEDVQVNLDTGLVVSNRRGIVRGGTGLIRGGILPGSDVARWYLAPGQNRVAVWGTDWDAAKTLVILRWQVRHLSADGAL